MAWGATAAPPWCWNSPSCRAWPADAERTRHYAWYNLLGDIGHALGALLAALPAVLRGLGLADQGEAYTWLFLLYALLLAAGMPRYLGLSKAVERSATISRVSMRVSPRSRRILWRIGALFGLDSVAGASSHQKSDEPARQDQGTMNMNGSSHQGASGLIATCRASPGSLAAPAASRAITRSQ
jgi:hypothetical protein